MSNRQRQGLLIVSLFAAPAWGGVSNPVPVGAQFQVNTYTNSNQDGPAVASDRDGDFVIVWQSAGSSGGDTSSQSIQGQRYAASGAAQGAQFQVNTYTTNIQTDPAVAMDADGDFVVVWESLGSANGDVASYSVQAQRYDANGATQGSQFLVNTYTTNIQKDASVALNADGDFVVVWSSTGSSGGDTLDTSVQGQRYDQAGIAQGGQFQVNTYTTNGQGIASVALDAEGDFAVIWVSGGANDGDIDFGSIQGQRYAANGATQGGQFRVNSYTTNNQTLSGIAMRPDGDFTVIWQSLGSSAGDTSDFSIQGQRYAAAGATQGAQFQVNTYTSLGQRRSSVATDDDGDFVVIWESNGASAGDTDTFSIQGQRYAAGGAPLGAQFQVNSYTTSEQTLPSVASDADGDFVVVWESIGSFGNDQGESVQAQRFRVTGDLQGRVFYDQDSDGIQDGGEPGMPDITVELYDDQLVLRRSTVTDGDGDYFLKPKEGGWHLKFVAPPGWNLTTQDVGGDDTVDSDADPETGETGVFEVTINVLDTTIDAGYGRLIFADGFESNDTSAWPL